MKKFLSTILIISLCAVCALLSACKKNIDYFDCVSEYRKSVYLYEDDVISVKVFSVDRETPYALDGVKGAVSNITEVFVSFEKTANEVELKLLDQGGEMSWLAVTRNYYLSFTGTELSGASVAVKVTIDGNETEYSAMNVAEEGTIDGKTALKCVREYDGESFAALTSGGVFAGEIYIRLIYDDGCYYYVGICDREKNVHAYLVSGADGRIIAERETQAE